MKKLPRPTVTSRTESGHVGIVLRFEWDFFAVEMFDDEALVMARMIHDELEGEPNG